MGDQKRKIMPVRSITKNEVDAGVVYATDAAVQANKIKIVATAPSGSHKPVVYPVAMVKVSKNEVLAKVLSRC